MSKHTPHNEKHQWIAVGAMVEYTNDDVADICSCDPQVFGQEAVNIPYEQQCANAILIACAPDMRELLNFIVYNETGGVSGELPNLEGEIDCDNYLDLAIELLNSTK